MVLKQLQHFLSYLQQFERVFIRQQIDTTLAERRYELSAKQKQIEKDEKRMDELDRLFRKIYEDNVNGKLNDERFCKLSDGYEAEQEQLKQEIESLTAEVSEADMETTNVSKLIAVTKKYTRIDELTPEILNAFVDKIVIHEREKRTGNGHSKSTFTIPMSGLWIFPQTRKCGKWRGNICSVLHVKPPE